MFHLLQWTAKMRLLWLQISSWNCFYFCVASIGDNRIETDAVESKLERYLLWQTFLCVINFIYQVPISEHSALNNKRIQTTNVYSGNTNLRMKVMTRTYGCQPTTLVQMKSKVAFSECFGRTIFTIYAHEPPKTAEYQNQCFNEMSVIEMVHCPVQKYTNKCHNVLVLLRFLSCRATHSRNPMSSKGWISCSLSSA